MHRALAYYQFDALRSGAVNHGIFTRLGGTSEGQWASLNMSRSTGDAAEPVAENRKRALDALGLTQEKSLTSWLVHGNHVRVVGHDDLGREHTNDVHADAMVTQARGLALTLRFADCVPVMFHDPVKQAVGIAHAGWKGVVNGVLPETVRAMQRAFGSKPSDIAAGVGPCIGPDKFEVGDDVAEHIQNAVSVNVVRRGAPAVKPTVDLWLAAATQLRDAGVGHVEVAGLCTASNTGEWFSHRAEQGNTGRFGAIIVLD